MQYINLYSGPTFKLDYRYARAMCLIYITMMYGVGLPILFPIAFLSFVITYFMDIIMIFYCYRIPPNYDSSLHLHQVYQMEWAVVIFLTFGFW